MRKSESNSITREDFKTQIVHQVVVFFFVCVPSVRCDLIVQSRDQGSKENNPLSSNWRHRNLYVSRQSSIHKSRIWSPYCSSSLRFFFGGGGGKIFQTKLHPRKPAKTWKTFRELKTARNQRNSAETMQKFMQNPLKPAHLAEICGNPRKRPNSPLEIKIFKWRLKTNDEQRSARQTGKRLEGWKAVFLDNVLGWETRRKKSNSGRDKLETR